MRPILTLSGTLGALCVFLSISAAQDAIREDYCAKHGGCRASPQPRQSTGNRSNTTTYRAPSGQSGSRNAPVYVPNVAIPPPQIYVPPSRTGQFSGAGGRVRNELDGMSLDGAKTLMSAAPKEITDRPYVKQMRELAQGYESTEQTITAIDEVLSNPREALEDKLRELGKEFSIETFKQGIALSIGWVFGADQHDDPDVQRLSKMGSDVVTTAPSFEGIRDRIETIKGGLRGYMEDKFAELKKELDLFDARKN